MTNKPLEYESIINKVKIKKNDKILLSADITQLLIHCKKNNKTFDANDFLNSIINKIGNDGTLILPTFNFDFCKGKTYDYVKTIPITGHLAKIALLRKDFKRTLHPIHSFTVWGRDKNYLCNLKNLSSFGSDSPFAYMHKESVKNFVVGGDYKLWLTIDHYCEETVGVDYRFLKNFKSSYIEDNKSKKLKTYQMYVRKNPELSIETGISSELDNILKSKNEYFKYKMFDTNFFLLNHKIIANIMINDIGKDQKIVFLRKK